MIRDIFTNQSINGASAAVSATESELFLVLQGVTAGMVGIQKFGHPIGIGSVRIDFQAAYTVTPVDADWVSIPGLTMDSTKPIRPLT
jgi:hypothetical protein